MIKLQTIELTECNSCGTRDWKIYSDRNLSQDGDGCFCCDEGKLFIVKKFRVLI